MAADVVPISDKLREAREGVLRGLLEAHSQGDIEGVIGCYQHPRIELVASGRVIDGTDAMREYLRARYRAFPDESFQLICHHHSDRAVVTEHWLSGTHLGTLHGVEPTGKRFRVRVAAIFEFDGEDLVGGRLYYDAGTIARQLA